MKRTASVSFTLNREAAIFTDYSLVTKLNHSYETEQNATEASTDTRDE